MTPGGVACALACLAGASLVAMPGARAQELPACPERVTVTEAWQGEVPAGWEAVRRPSQHPLADIRFHAGPPASAPMIEPIAGNSTGHMFSLRYQLGTTAGEVWMACIYADTAHVLVRLLPGPFPPHVRVNHDRRERRVFISYF